MITIPNSVTEIGRRAFSGCAALQSVNIPSGVTKISDDEFSYCGALSSINLPDTVTQIGTEAFLGCKDLDSLIISDHVTSIGRDAFDSDITLHGSADSYAAQYSVTSHILFATGPDSWLITAVPLTGVTVDGRALKMEAYSINGRCYFKLADLAAALNGTKKKFAYSNVAMGNSLDGHIIYMPTITRGVPYIPVGGELTIPADFTSKGAATTAGLDILIYGRGTTFSAYKIDGDIYCDLSDVAKEIGFSASYNAKTNTAAINSNPKQ